MGRVHNRAQQDVHGPKLPGESSPPYARVTALWRNSSKSSRFMDPPPDLVTLALLIALSRQYTPWLCESIYCLEPMLTTWAEWKCKASLLDNQWRHFWDTL